MGKLDIAIAGTGVGEKSDSSGTLSHRHERPGKAEIHMGSLEKESSHAGELRRPPRQRASESLQQTV